MLHQLTQMELEQKHRTVREIGRKKVANPEDAALKARLQACKESIIMHIQSVPGRTYIRIDSGQYIVLTEKKSKPHPLTDEYLHMFTYTQFMRIKFGRAPDAIEAQEYATMFFKVHAEQPRKVAYGLSVSEQLPLQYRMVV